VEIKGGLVALADTIVTSSHDSIAKEHAACKRLDTPNMK
jgi:hypothetical protein